MSLIGKKRRLRKKYVIRSKIRGTSVCPRLTVTKTCQHLYAQIIDDDRRITLCSASTLDKLIRLKNGKSSCNILYAKEVGKLLAQKAKEKGISRVVFDRNGYVYHGRVKALSDTCREAGLVF